MNKPLKKGTFVILFRCVAILQCVWGRTKCPLFRGVLYSEDPFLEVTQDEQNSLSYMYDARYHSHPYTLSTTAYLVI